MSEGARAAGFGFSANFHEVSVKRNKNGKEPLVVLIDNYDSFTYNVYQYICEIIPNAAVFRNDEITVSEIAGLNPDFVVISPGPKEPRDAGISKEVIGKLGKKTNILGICLGHQCINEVFGGRTIRAPRVYHGKTTKIINDQRTLFRGLPKEIEVARYHSLIVDRDCLSKDFEISAWTGDGVVMGIRHKKYPIEGVQFHPESFLTKFGKEMMKNYFCPEKPEIR
ncbi:MAG: aminodeoxychorismate/anthranilate synthase component II [Candidatus Aminicenantes bacterium]|nr:aminodeoxychorismate/anthranilate synthase component II [Candidatus Aminicenantes bacterium]